jgi:transcriptional regulator with XRE-family HTH domain
LLATIGTGELYLMAALPNAARGPRADRSETSDVLFGARLREERERRRITLASIAANTKIGLHLLEGLERGHVSRWPSGIFRRSFIRAYAEAIGLDPDEIAREFLGRFPDPTEMPELTPAFVARKPPADDAVLRLNLADLESTSARGRLLIGMRPRWAAVAWDACVLVTIGLMFFIAFNQFWMPLALATLGYYGASILLLGNTPGVSLFAPDAASRGPNRFVVSPASLFKACGVALKQAGSRRGEAANR